MIRFEHVTVDARGEPTARVAAEARLVTEDLGGGVLLDLVAVEAGTFRPRRQAQSPPSTAIAAGSVKSSASWT